MCGGLIPGQGEVEPSLETTRGAQTTTRGHQPSHQGHIGWEEYT